MCFELTERGWKVIFILFALILLLTLPSQAADYEVVDTGQDECYDTLQTIPCPQAGDPFYGQDAQYFGNQPSYTNNGDSTITDNVTGLTWTKSPDLDGDGDIDVDDKLSFADALTYPDTLNAKNFGGHSDWRLPSIKELYSLMSFSGTDPSGPDGSGAIPFIDTAYFDFAYGDTSAGERIIDAQFWSSNVYLGTVFGDQEAAFGLNLADGRIKGYPIGGPVSKLNYVYFVRGNTNCGVNDFTDNGDSTITDNATGLMWMKNDNGAGILWENALGYAEGLEYAGYTDWRLPNAKEMQSIVDYSRAPDATGSAAIDPVFNITQITNEAGKSITRVSGPVPLTSEAMVVVRQLHISVSDGLWATCPSMAAGLMYTVQAPSEAIPRAATPTTTLMVTDLKGMLSASTTMFAVYATRLNLTS